MSDFVTFRHLGSNGRLGNSLMQISAVLGYAKKHNLHPVFPKWICDQTGRDMSVYFKNKLDYSLDTSKIEGDWYEPHFHYHEIPSGKNLSLNGYFQSEKYFYNAESEVRKAFEFTDEIKERAEFAMPIGRNKVAVHFRFGDYLNLQHFMIQLTQTDYYQRAFKEFPDALFVVFSDNKDMANEFMERCGVAYEIADGGEDMVEMCMMGMCDGAVIANSSFSWWGAFLGNKKKVVAPLAWFGEAAKIDSKDLIPENWKKL